MTILYWNYDALGRVTEHGDTCVAAWSGLKTYADQPDWPSDAANWRFRYSYDGDDTQANAVGRLTTLDHQ